jgi:hypothetical protein
MSFLKFTLGALALITTASPALSQGAEGALPARPQGSNLAPGLTVELARTTDGTPVAGVRIEGDIVPGDTLKLLVLRKIRQCRCIPCVSAVERR